MKTAALLCLLTALSPLSVWSSNNKIIGGQKSAGHDFFLQMSMDGTLKTAFCGATAIAPGVAITAAHCVGSKTMNFKLIHGIAQDGVDKLTVIDVKAIVPHQSYDGKFNDLALIFFDEDQAKDVVVPAPINRGQIELNQDSKLRAIGRGNLTSIGTIYDSILYEVRIPYVDNATCQAVGDYKGAVNDSQICAGELKTGGTDSCQGDSGGPLVAMVDGKATLVGITNFGLGCGQKGLPGVYASLKYHASWIDTNIARYKNNEIVPEPNMDYAFASKCHIMKADQEVTQQKNENNFGGISMVSLYQQQTRFMKIGPQILNPKAKNICNFSIGQNSYIASEDTATSKILIQNATTKQWWSAKSKRRTDSFYQRCMQYSPAVSFEIAVQDGSAMINVNDSVAPLIPIDAAQVPADTTKVAGCSIGRYETTISTSQSAQAVLVTLKNHIDDETMVLVMGGGGAAADASSPASGSLSASMTIESANTAHLTIDNSSNQDLFTWELTCNKEFSLFNNNRISPTSLRFMAPSDPKATVLEGQSTELTVNFAGDGDVNADGKLECQINREIKVQIK